MRSRTFAVLLQPLAVVALVMIIFVLGNATFRRFEATMATDLLHMLDLLPANRIQVISGFSSIAVFPLSVGPFVAVIQPSCSALASLLAITFLAWFVPRGRTGRRIVALGCALVCVLVGNVLRIAGSVGVGLVYGTPSLVLFHDFVGSMFAFAYTLGGYLLMLFLLLPKGTAAARSTERIGASTPVNTPITTIRGTTVAAPARERRGAHRVSV